MGAGHDHGHAHGHGAGTRNVRRLWISLALTGTYLIAEVLGGLATGSLALLADAGHMLSDVAALGLALFAMFMARRPAGRAHTYGYHRVEILAALANAMTLVAVAFVIVVEAVERFGAPQPVDGTGVFAIAAGGLLVNLVSMLILSGGRNESLNVRGAWLHVLTDALGSLQAMVAGVLIWAFGWSWVDPLSSVLIALLVVYSSWSLLKETLAVLMESAPGGLDVEEVRRVMLAVNGVEAVTDLHVWTISSGLVALSAHVTSDQQGSSVVERLHEVLHDRFHIQHVTVQVDDPGIRHRCQIDGGRSEAAVALPGCAW